MPKIKLCPSQQRERNITAALEKARIDKGWTKKHLGELLHMPSYKISRIINHPANEKLSTVLLVANKLGIDSLPVQ